MNFNLDSNNDDAEFVVVVVLIEHIAAYCSFIVIIQGSLVQNNRYGTALA